MNYTHKPMDYCTTLKSTSK